MPLVAYITININPVPFHIGPVPIHWYGIIMAIALLVGAYVFARQLPKRGIASDHVFAMLLWAVPLAVVGARLFHVLDDIGFYWRHPGQIWTGQLVGLAIYGGVLGIFIYCRRAKLPFLRVLDCLALAIPVGQLVDKCANIINGDTWGYATRLPWGFVYKNPHAFLPTNLLGVPTQPTPVYEQLWLLVLTAAARYVHRLPCGPAQSPAPADRLGNHEGPRLGPPYLLPEAGAHEGDYLEGRAGQGSRRLEVGHAQAVGQRGAATVVTINELEHSRRFAKRR